MHITTPADQAAWESAKALFTEYARTLDFNLCFQDFEAELASLKVMYHPPEGILLLLQSGGAYFGCAGVRRWDAQIAELKRMYVREKYRGRGAGQLLLNAALAEARNLGYEKIRLDTLPSMQAAMQMYRNNGFYEIEAYRFNPEAGTLFFEKQL